MKTMKFKRIIGAVTAAVMSISAMSIVPEMFDSDSWLDLSVMAETPSVIASVKYDGETQTLTISNNQQSENVILNKNLLTNYKNTKKIIFEVSGNHKIYFPEDSSELFKNFYYLESIECLDKVNTSNVTNMSSMFENCEALSTLTFGDNINTAGVTNMSNMFYGCKALTSLDVSGFNTAKVTDMSGMFEKCVALSTLTFGNSFSTSNVTNMSNLFSSCNKLTTLDLSKFNTSKVTKMEYMFYDCKALNTIMFGDNFDTKEVKQMNSMFQSCEALAVYWL